MDLKKKIENIVKQSEILTKDSKFSFTENSSWCCNLMAEKRSGKIGLSDRKIAASSFTSVNIFYSVKFYALGCMQE